MEMIVQGRSVSFFHASQHRSAIWSQNAKILFDNQLSQMNCHMFSTGVSSGDPGGSGRSMTFGGIERGDCQANAIGDPQGLDIGDDSEPEQA